jgi:hypothetical protein
MSNKEKLIANTNATIRMEGINMAEKNLKTREAKKKKAEKVVVADPTSTVKKTVKKPKKTY